MQELDDAEDDADEESEEPKSLFDHFNEIEPYYLSIGMTHEQFWDDDPWLVDVYRRAHNLQIEARNQELWLQGLYIYDAFNTVMANFGRSLSKNKSGKEAKYVEKPIRITPLTDAERKQKEKEERRKVIAHFTALQKQFERQEKAKQK